MATIHKEFEVAVPPRFAWEAIKAVGDVHSRLAAGFAVDTVLEGTVRTVTFANGVVAQEQIVTVDDDLQRLAYAAINGKPSHHNASIQVFPTTGNASRIVWTTDVLPDEMALPVSQMVEAGAAAIKATLEAAYAHAPRHARDPA